MMEAANKETKQAGGKSIALGISLPFEQGVNQFADPELSFEFHYFSYANSIFSIMPKYRGISGRFWYNGRTLRDPHPCPDQ